MNNTNQNNEAVSQDESASIQEKIQPLLYKLRPYQQVMRRFKDRAQAGYKGLRIVIALAVAFGMTGLPQAMASELALTQDPLGTLQPTTTADAPADTTTQTTTAAKTVSNADSFLQASPLSSPTVQAETTGRTLYVATTGSDTNAGDQNNPYKSLQKAISSLQAGDTLVIKAGTYQESADITVSGTADAYITIRGEDGVVIDGDPLNDYEPIFDTKGSDYIRFENLTVKNARDAVEVSPGSQFIVIDGLNTDHNHFAVKVNSATNVTIRNVVATNSRNGFRVENNGGTVPSNILFENIKSTGAKDIYTGYESVYRNGDGFILEAGNNITLRNIESYDNWDGGFDIKANNVLVENVKVWGNKNNFKIWGTSIVVKNALIRNARYLAEDPIAGEGNGVNARRGSVTFINSTFVDNDVFDIKADNDGGASKVTLENCVIARKKTTGEMYTNLGGTLVDSNNTFYWQGHSNPGFTINGTSQWANPGFVDWDGKDFHLTGSSPALEAGSNGFPISSTDLDGNARVVGSLVDAGAYEYGSTTTVTPVTMVGLASGATVNGTINVGPDLTQHKGVTKVVYALDGSASGTSTVSPFYWGGTAGTGSTGFDTTKIANGAHALLVTLTDSQGTRTKTINFSVNNTTNPPPSGDVAGLTNGQTVSGTILVNPNLVKHPDVRKVAYYLNGAQSGKVYTSPFYWGGISGTGATGFDTTKIPNGDHMLSVTYTDSTGDHTVQVAFKVLNGVTPPPGPDFSGVSNGATVTGTVNIGPNLTTYPNVTKAVYTLNGAASGTSTVSPFYWGGTTGTGAAGFDTTKIPNGTYTLQAVLTTGTTTKTVQTQFTVNNTVTPPPTTDFVGVTDGQSVTGTVNIGPNLTKLTGVSKVAYYLNGAKSGKVYSSPFLWGGLSGTGTGGFDTTKIANGTYSLAMTYTQNGVDKTTTITFKVANGTTPAPTPTPTTTGDFTGVTAGGTVSGVSSIGPNLTKYPTARKVAYYLNGAQSGKVYTSPFLWGGLAGTGVSGLDTTKLANGTYTLSMILTDATGDHNVSVQFTIAN
ncbi:MAG TPA: right-handed parallel beta-helix repeat-containing protein [Verrucomicrobiae bacterium]|nr:right-handed parallel beta-helix repeat-containing protein [Verrucomicrobiae bacterium]